MGGILQTQGDLAGALKAYQSYLAIAERLVAKDPANTGWQREVSVSDICVGRILQMQGDLAGALKVYQAGRAIMAQLVAREPANTDWQGDLSDILK